MRSGYELLPRASQAPAGGPCRSRSRPAVGGQQGDGCPGPVRYFLGHPQEMGRGDVAIGCNQDGGLALLRHPEAIPPV